MNPVVTGHDLARWVPAVAAIVWSLISAPPLVAFAIVVAGAIAWCRWLERHATPPPV